MVAKYKVPEVVAHDMHPEYLSSKWAAELGLPTIAVQHHHAHVAACMVEHGRTEPVLGIAYDGLGYGPDGSLWGGEMLIADFTFDQCECRVESPRFVSRGGWVRSGRHWRRGQTTQCDEHRSVVSTRQLSALFWVLPNARRRR